MTKEVLKLALEALKAAQELAGKHDAELEYGFQQAIAAIKEALAQEQEPVAWALEWTFDGEEKGRRLYDDERQCKFNAENDGGVCRPLVYGNTAPPQRTWLGLTDEEMEATFLKCGGKWYGDFWKIEDADFHPFLRTIEAKLKEKNT